MGVRTRRTLLFFAAFLASLGVTSAGTAAPCVCANAGTARTVTPKRVRDHGFGKVDDPAFGSYFAKVPADNKRSTYIADIRPSVPGAAFADLGISAPLVR